MYNIRKPARGRRQARPKRVPVLGCRVHLVREAEVAWPESPIKCPLDAYSFVRPLLEDRDREHMVAVYLDTKNRVIGVHTVSIGGIASTRCEPRAVFTPALLCNAARIIVSHNHPSGDPVPSPEDIACASALRAAGEILGIPVLDFIIVGRGTFYSLKERRGI